MTGLCWKLLICVNLVHSNGTAFSLCSFYTITLLITLVFPCFSKGNVFYHPHTILSPSTFLSLFYFLFFYLRLLWYVILDILPFFNRRVGGYLPSWFFATLWMTRQRSRWRYSFFSRHFDQVKRVEKSPKAKQGYAMKSVLDGWNPLRGWNLP